MRLLISTICLLTLSGFFWLSAPPKTSLAQTFSAPQQTSDEELKTDDGTTEGSPVGLVPNLIVVNRLTPARYPATLKAIRVFFRNVTPQSPVGRQIRLVAFARTPSTAGTVNNPTLLVSQTVTVPSVSTAGEFVEFAIQNGPTINSGDLFVGFQQPETNNVPFFWFDTSQPSQNRGFASLDNGASYNGDIRVGGDNSSVNFMIRAVVTVPGALATVSAASFATGALASESIAAVFGSNLAAGMSIAATLPLPTTLGGVSARVRDSVGTERLAPLFFVSPGQINLLIPPGTSIGPATLTVSNASGIVATGALNILAIAPGLFTFAANGSGFPAANTLRLKPDGSFITTPVARFDSSLNRYVANPIEFGDANDRTFLILFGTGIRGRSSLNSVSVNISFPISYAGAQSDFAGLDQVNVELPRSLAGRGDVDFDLVVDQSAANRVKVNFK